jgi:hypothetical protein
MKHGILVRVAWCALVIGCLSSPWAHGTEKVAAGAAPSKEQPESSRSDGVTGNALQTALTVHKVPDLNQRPLLVSRALSAKHAAASGNLPRRPELTGLARRSAVAATRAHGTGAAPLPANANRLSSGVPGIAARSIATLKPSTGNGVVGGPHVQRGGMIGGPGNSRSVMKASIDGSAFHHRS